MIIEEPEAQPHVVPEVKKTEINDIKMYRYGPHKYNTRSSTNRVEHVTTFKIIPNIFKIHAEEKISTHIGTYDLAHIDPKKYTITVEPLANHINCENTGNKLRYRDPVNMDSTVWKNSMCNKLCRLSQGWVKHAVTDTI